MKSMYFDDSLYENEMHYKISQYLDNLVMKISSGNLRALRYSFIVALSPNETKRLIRLDTSAVTNELAISLHPSMLGRIDLVDNSSSDPGQSTALSPWCDMKSMYFDDSLYENEMHFRPPLTCFHQIFCKNREDPFQLLFP